MKKYLINGLIAIVAAVALFVIPELIQTEPEYRLMNLVYDPIGQKLEKTQEIIGLFSSLVVMIGVLLLMVFGIVSGVAGLSKKPKLGKVFGILTQIAFGLCVVAAVVGFALGQKGTQTIFLVQSIVALAGLVAMIVISFLYREKKTK